MEKLNEKSTANNLFDIYEWKYIPIGYITQSKNNQICARESLKDLKTLHSEFCNKKLYFALAHKNIVSMIKRNPNLCIAINFPFGPERNITTHKEKLFDSCRKCDKRCHYKSLLNQSSKIEKGIILFIRKVNR